jgi:HEXXH motif-containing protein
LYFSAIKECGRPAIYILLAYHAFANVCLFFDKAARCGFDCGPEYASYLAELRRKVDSLEVQLQSIKSFTPHGDMLWRALADRLHCEEETLGQ